MKNYLAFFGSVYYPCGGMDDFIGDYDTLEEAMQAIEDAHKKYSPEDDKWLSRWANVWSVKDRMEVYSK